MVHRLACQGFRPGGQGVAMPRHCKPCGTPPENLGKPVYGSITTTIGISLPAGRAETGPPERLIPELAEAATRDHCTETDPRQASAGDYEALFRAAMG